MIVGVPKESYPGERRVALVPAVTPNLAKAGLEVVVESGAGVEAGYPDADYIAKGAKVLGTRAEVFQTADVIVQVLAYGSNDKTGTLRSRAISPRPNPDRLSPSLWLQRSSQRSRANRRHLFRRGINAAHHSRSIHGRALIDVHSFRLQSRDPRRRYRCRACFRCSPPPPARSLPRAC